MIEFVRLFVGRMWFWSLSAGRAVVVIDPTVLVVSLPSLDNVPAASFVSLTDSCGRCHHFWRRPGAAQFLTKISERADIIFWFGPMEGLTDRDETNRRAFICALLCHSWHLRALVGVYSVHDMQSGQIAPHVRGIRSWKPLSTIQHYHPKYAERILFIGNDLHHDKLAPYTIHAVWDGNTKELGGLDSLWWKTSSYLEDWKPC